MEAIEDDVLKLINHSHSMAMELLTKQGGEFYPFGAKVDNQGDLTNIGYFGGDEFPLSQTIINELTKDFEEAVAEGKIRAYAITYDCFASKNSDSEKTDAVAIECFTKGNGQNEIYYFPYKKLPTTEFEFGEAWVITKD